MLNTHDGVEVTCCGQFLFILNGTILDETYANVPPEDEDEEPSSLQDQGYQSKDAAHNNEGNLSKNQPAEDDLDRFAKDVASECRAIADVFKRETTKKKIRDILYEARFADRVG